MPSATEGAERVALGSMELVFSPFFTIACTHEHRYVSHRCVSTHPGYLIRNSSNHAVQLLTRLAIAATELFNVFVRTDVVRVLAGDVTLNVETVNQPPPL